MPTATPFNNLITFSRGSNATVVGPNGLIQWAPNNLLLQSESFDAAAWTKSNVTVTANNAAAPDGTTTAELVTPTAADCNVRQSFTPVGAVQYTFSMWLRSATGSDISTSIRAWRDSPFQSAGITTITVTPTWERFTLTFTALDATSHFVVVGAGSTLSTGENLFIWGAQLELGSTATTYNPTTVKNLLGFSEAFDNAAWSKSGTSIVTGAQANPVNGLFTAQKVMENTATGVHNCGQSITTTAIPYTFSCYIKAAERTFALLYHTQTNAAVSINLITGATGTPTGLATPTASSVVALGNGWYRLSMTVTATAASNFFGIYPMTSLTGSASYTGDGNSGVYIYGAQLSDSASLDPYVPTPGAAPSSTAFYGPRFDFDPVTLQPRGILIEEQRTNLATYSNTFSDASWSAIGTKNLVANSTVSPDGEVNASTLTDNSAAAFQGMGKTVTVANDNATYTASIYVRKTTGGTSATFGFNFQLTGGTVVGISPRLNTDTGALLSGSGTVQNAGAYWRLIATITNNTTGNTSLGLSVYAATAAYNSGTDSAAATGSAILYGAQIEAGAFATSYIPTVASTVTRSADVATITGQNFAQWYSSSAGSFVAEFRTIEAGVMSATSYVLAMDTSGSKRLIYVASGADVATTFDGTTIIGAVGDVTGINAKVASAYDGSGRAIVSNGGAVATGAVVAAYSASTVLNIGSLGGGQSLGWLRNIRFIPARAADFQLQALST